MYLPHSTFIAEKSVKVFHKKGESSEGKARTKCETRDFFVRKGKVPRGKYKKSVRVHRSVERGPRLKVGSDPGGPTCKEKYDTHTYVLVRAR